MFFLNLLLQVSSMAMGKDTEDVLKCGISVAPVVNWHYYGN